MSDKPLDMTNLEIAHPMPSYPTHDFKFYIDPSKVQNEQVEGLCKGIKNQAVKETITDYSNISAIPSNFLDDKISDDELAKYEKVSEDAILSAAEARSIRKNYLDMMNNYYTEKLLKFIADKISKECHDFTSTKHSVSIGLNNDEIQKIDMDNVISILDAKGYEAFLNNANTVLTVSWSKLK